MDCWHRKLDDASTEAEVAREAFVSVSTIAAYIATKKPPAA